MITPPNGPIVTPPVNSEVYPGLWIKSLQIDAPSPTKPINVTAQIVPFNPVSGSLAIGYGKLISIRDVENASIASPEIAEAMAAVFTAIQGQVISKSLF